MGACLNFIILIYLICEIIETGSVSLSFSTTPKANNASTSAFDDAKNVENFTSRAADFRQTLGAASTTSSQNKKFVVTSNKGASPSLLLPSADRNDLPKAASACSPTTTSQNVPLENQKTTQSNEKSPCNLKLDPEQQAASSLPPNFLSGLYVNEALRSKGNVNTSPSKINFKVQKPTISYQPSYSPSTIVPQNLQKLLQQQIQSVPNQVSLSEFNPASISLLQKQDNSEPVTESIVVLRGLPFIFLDPSFRQGPTNQQFNLNSQKVDSNFKISTSNLCPTSPPVQSISTTKPNLTQGDGNFRVTSFIPFSTGSSLSFPPQNVQTPIQNVPQNILPSSTQNVVSAGPQNGNSNIPQNVVVQNTLTNTQQNSNVNVPPNFISGIQTSCNTYVPQDIITVTPQNSNNNVPQNILTAKEGSNIFTNIPQNIILDQTKSFGNHPILNNLIQPINSQIQSPVSCNDQQVNLINFVPQNIPNNSPSIFYNLVQQNPMPILSQIPAVTLDDNSLNFINQRPVYYGTSPSFNIQSNSNIPSNAAPNIINNVNNIEVLPAPEFLYSNIMTNLPNVYTTQRINTPCTTTVSSPSNLSYYQNAPEVYYATSPSVFEYPALITNGLQITAPPSLIDISQLLSTYSLERLRSSINYIPNPPSNDLSQQTIVVSSDNVAPCASSSIVETPNVDYLTPIQTNSQPFNYDQYTFVPSQTAEIQYPNTIPTLPISYISSLPFSFDNSYETYAPTEYTIELLQPTYEVIPSVAPECQPIQAYSTPPQYPFPMPPMMPPPPPPLIIGNSGKGSKGGIGNFIQWLILAQLFDGNCQGCDGLGIDDTLLALLLSYL